MSPTGNAPPNKELHRTVIPLRFIAGGERGRSAAQSHPAGGRYGHTDGPWLTNTGTFNDIRFLANTGDELRPTPASLPVNLLEALGQPHLDD